MGRRSAPDEDDVQHAGDGEGVQLLFGPRQQAEVGAEQPGSHQRPPSQHSNDLCPREGRDVPGRYLAGAKRPTRQQARLQKFLPLGHLPLPCLREWPPRDADRRIWLFNLF